MTYWCEAGLVTKSDGGVAISAPHDSNVFVDSKNADCFRFPL